MAAAVKQPTFYMGYELPPLYGDDVWLMLIYPGGRAVVVKARPHWTDSVEEAITKIAKGMRAFVRLDDAVTVYQAATKQERL